jgi:broad specificity phosphatase PhoE
VIVLVRHGRTDANAQGLLLGRLDPGLDAEGAGQAARLAVACASLDVVRVVTSPLGRCRQTAEVVAAAVGGGIAPEVDDRWIELDYGELDGRPLAEVPAATGAAWRADVTWSPAGGESLADLGDRVRAACVDLVADARDRDVVVVTHVSPIKAAVAWALGVGDEVSWRMWVATASMTRIGLAGGVPSLRSFNEIGYLA